MEQSALKPGTRLDRYELVCPIGQGGMASVWVARLRGKRGFENLVAIKTILPQHAGDLAFERMFVNEARIAAGIRHANVASVLDVGETNGLLYLVFEWVQGERLSLLSGTINGKGENFDTAIALRIAADMCTGLHAAHELRDSSGIPLMIVHRDVSPQNVMVTTSGCVKVIDFGVAKALHRLGDNTDAGIIKGKMSYLAPEMARGESADRRADVWAAGVVLYELLAGKLPIQGETREATAVMIGRGTPPAPLPERVPQAIAEIVSRALTISRDERFQTAGELHRALEGVLAREYGPVTSEDVAAYLEKHLGAHVARRASTIAGALESCREGERSVAPVAEDSYPSVSIGESSISEIYPDDEPAVPPQHVSRRPLRAAVALAVTLIATLAVLASAFARRAPASNALDARAPEPPAADSHATAPPPVASESVPVALPPVEVAPPASASQKPSQPKPTRFVAWQPMPMPNNPRVIFGSKR